MKIDKTNHFSYLFIALTGMLFSAAVVAQAASAAAKIAFSGVLVVMLLLSIKSLHLRFTLKTLAALLLTAMLINHFNTGVWSHLFVLSVLLAFFVIAFASAFRQVLFEGEIDRNKIIGSVTLYMLLGNIWTVLYLMILVFDPDAFNGIDITSWQEGFAKIAYYSFVTLTTLGYGDISPKTPVAQFFVYMEAIFGVFYMAIVVSSIVAMRLASVRHPEEET
jgi:voltage-gated potassium channel Kch